MDLRDAANRDLLFGLLALQNGLVEQDVLLAAFRAWTRDKSRPIAEILASQGGIDDDDRAAIEVLATRHLRHHGDDVERSLAAVAAPTSIVAGLAAIGDPDVDNTLGHVPHSRSRPTVRDDALNDAATISMGDATSDGRRFRVLRPHASGGLGEVFVALDAELNREVALKQILEHHADDPTSRTRFVLEAEITGGLEHPGIVPVYGLGAYGDGRPYYAMRFVRGDSLKHAVAAFHADETLRSDPGPRSLALRKLLRRFVDVCNAIEYAHSRGVLHRDIKPANVIVGRHGETLVVDWGLAKAVGKSGPGAAPDERTLVPSSASGSAETLPGSALGTPAYMSPEQAAGDLDRLGPRSDVYSLGATLYCLLTGKPPFEGDDLGEILRTVRRGEFPRPRQVDQSIDGALEAVCLKAMATESGGRYSSCRALAEDVERWMADEPVSAWAEPWTRRLARWLSRHRTGVTAAAAFLLAGVAGLGAVLAVQSAANGKLSDSLNRETRANDELKRSKAAVQDRYDLAVDAIRTLHKGVSEDFLLKEPNFKEPRDRLLKSASNFYGKLGALLGKETDIASRRALADSNFELAELTEKVGRKEDALAAHRAVLAAREAFAAEPGADTATKVDVGRSLTAIAFVLESTGRADEALAVYRRSESLLAVLASSGFAAKAALAACRTKMARLLMLAGKSAEAMEALKLARADQEALAAAPGASSSTRLDLGETIKQIGAVLVYTGKMAEAEPEFRTSLPLFQKLVDDEPGVAEFRRGLADTHRLLSRELYLTGHPAAAEAESRRSLVLYRKLADDNPAVTRFRGEEALSRVGLGRLLMLTGKPGPEGEYRAAIAILQKLVDDNPTDTDHRTNLAICHNYFGPLLLHMGRTAEARDECLATLALCQRLADEHPTTHRVRIVSWSLLNLGDVERSLDRKADAKHLYERATSITEPLFHENPKDADRRNDLVELIWRRAMTLRDLGDPSGGAAEVRRALRLCEDLPPRTVTYLLETACCHALLASQAGREGSGVAIAEGQMAGDRAMNCLRQAVEMGYRNGNELRFEAALDSLRSRPDFQLLMRDVAFPIDPFCR
jgi:eukaryotic-like serine/threonine-protein kinase